MFSFARRTRPRQTSNTAVAPPTNLRAQGGLRSCERHATISRLSNNGLHQTGRGGVAFASRRRPVVEARPAGEPGCSTNAGGARLTAAAQSDTSPASMSFPGPQGIQGAPPPRRLRRASRGFAFLPSKKHGITSTVFMVNKPVFWEGGGASSGPGHRHKQPARRTMGWSRRGPRFSLRALAAQPGVRQAYPGWSDMRQIGIFFVLAMLAGCAAPIKSEGVMVPMAPPPRPVSELIGQLAAPDAPSRASAAWALAGAKQADATTLAALKAALDDPSGPVREAASWALGHLTLPDSDQAALSMDSPPKLLVQTRPVYPPAAFSKKLEGIVRVEVLINETGRVAHAEVRRSIPELDRAALACVREWQFQPATRAGKPVSVVAQTPISFRIY